MSRQFRWALALWLSAWAGAGCSCGASKGLQGVAPKVTAQVLAESGVAVHEDKLKDGQALDFGTVPLRTGAPPSKLLALRDEGNAPLHFSKLPTLKLGDQSPFTLQGLLARNDCGLPAAGSVLPVGGCATVLISFTPTALGGAADELIVASDDPARPDWHIPLVAVGAQGSVQVCAIGGAAGTGADACAGVGVAPVEIDFGSATPGFASPQRTARVLNGGALPLHVARVELRNSDDAADFVIDTAGWNDELAPGASHDFHVQFNPNSGGARKAYVDVWSDDPATVATGTPVSLLLVGQGDAPALCIDPLGTVDFGETEVGQPSGQTVSLRSCGTQDLSIDGLTIDGAATFTVVATNVDSVPAVVPTLLHAGQSLVVDMHYNPTQVGPEDARLNIQSNDANSPFAFVPLHGTGVRNGCQLTSTTTTLDLGTAAIGRSAHRNVVLHNAGRLPCTLTALDMDGLAGTARFTLAAPPTLPLEVQGNGFLSLDVQFSPQSAAVNQVTGTLSVASDDPASPLLIHLRGEPVAQAACKLQITPTFQNGTFNSGRTLNFGQVRSGSVRSLPILVTNVGSDVCTVSSLARGSLTDHVFSVGTATPALPQTLQPGDSSQVLVNFAPTGDTTYDPLTNTLTMQTTDPVAGECGGGFPPGNNPNGCKKFLLQGSGGTARVSAFPDSVDFGLVTVGCNSPTKLVRVYNSGRTSVNITNIYVDPSSAPFVLVHPPATYPVALAAGTSVDIQVKYAPPDANTHTALLVIESDAQNTLAVPLSGQGTTDGHQHDVFHQPLVPKSDILWVVDNSASMSDKQQLLSSNAQRFMQVVQTQSVDYHIGVTTTQYSPTTATADSSSAWQGDPIEAGVLFGRPKQILPTDVDPLTEFQKNVRVGECCSDTQESGLEAAYEALTAPKINDPAKNGGFLRPDAKLHVIVVSDENDQSPSTVAFYVDVFKHLKSSPQLFALSSIVGDRGNGCDSNGVTAVEGPRYIDAANQLGGIDRSICSADWGQVAQDLAFNSFTTQTTFFLSRAANPSTLSVKVNGTAQNIPSQVGFDAANNAVVFTQQAAPPPGATIDVEYDTYCY